MMREYRIKVTLRNNLLLSAIEAAGYKTQSDFARAIDVNPNTLNALVGMRMAPLCANGEFSAIAKQVMEGLGAAPCDLWTDKQMVAALSRNSGETTMDENGVQALLDRPGKLTAIEYAQEEHAAAMTLPDPEVEGEKAELATLVGKMLHTLTPRQEQVLRMRYELGLTLEEIAARFGVTRERIRKIEFKALHQLQQPDRAAILGAYKPD